MQIAMHASPLEYLGAYYTGNLSRPYIMKATFIQLRVSGVGPLRLCYVVGLKGAEARGLKFKAAIYSALYSGSV